MSLINSLTILVGIYLLGVLISKWTNGRVGSALATLPIMFIMFWTGILTPADIDASHLPAVYDIMTAVILVNVGTTFDLKMLRKEWRLVILCLGSLLGCGVIVLTVGTILFGRDLAFTCYPSLAGGMVATMLMQQAALEKGLEEVAAIVLLVLTVQQWFSMPLITNFTRLEAKRLQKGFDPAMIKQTGTSTTELAATPQKAKLIDRLPESYNNPYIDFFLLCLFSAIANWLSSITSAPTKGLLGSALVGMIVGVVARAAGVITKDPLSRSKLMPFFMLAMVMSMRKSLAALSVQGLLNSLIPVVGIILLGAVGIIGVAILVGKFVGLSVPMSIVVGIQAYSGYPINYQMGLETIEAVATTPEEQEYLKAEILPKIVIGGVISVSVASVIIGSIFVSLL